MDRRPGRLFALVLALALVAAALERTAVAVRARLVEPSGAAHWIWAPGLERKSHPVAFYAVRDFEVGDGVKTARLAITADWTYVLYVNGRRVGSGGYRRGASPDLYDVAAELEPGWNRLAVELASGRGGGGLLARLEVDGETLAATDARWLAVRRFEPGLLRGWPLEGGEPVAVWERPPTGRWRLGPPTDRAAFSVELAGTPVRRARRVRRAGGEGPWHDLEPLDRLSRSFGPWLVFDWGEEVTGYLTLELAADAGNAGLLHVGREVPDEAAPAAALIVPVPGRDLWVDSFPRSFRYACVMGFELRRPPAVQLSAPEPGGGAEGAALLRAGVFGLTPPGGGTPAEQELRLALGAAAANDE